MSSPSTSTLPPNSGTLSTHVTDGVATLRFGHPKGNSLPAPLLGALTSAVRALGADPAVRAIVVRSEGAGPFCAGASFDELRRITTPAEGREFFMGFARLILAMRSCPKLIVARVHGKVVGGGVGMVAAADYAIARSDVAVKLSELAIGIGPFVVGPVIQHKIGLAAFQALAVDAASWRDAHWAERVGLFAQLAPDDAALDGAVAALSARLAHSNPEAMAALKEVFWRGTSEWEALLPERAETSGRLAVSDFTRQAIAAFASR